MKKQQIESAPNGEQITLAWREFTDAVCADWNTAKEKLSAAERRARRKRADAAAEQLNTVQARARDSFAAARGLRYAPDLSNHHRDAFVAADDKRKPPARVLVEVVHGYTDDGHEKPTGPNVTILPFSWCHGLHPKSWVVAITKEQQTTLNDGAKWP